MAEPFPLPLTHADVARMIEEVVAHVCETQRVLDRRGSFLERFAHRLPLPVECAPFPAPSR